MISKISPQRLMLIFWSAMDAFYILYAFVYSFRGFGPVANFQDALFKAENWGPEAVVLFWVSLVVQMSVLVSSVLFFCGSRLAIHLAIVQFPFRILFAIPSVSAMLVWGVLFGGISWWIVIPLKLFSELLKAWSLWWLQRGFDTQGDKSAQ